jgi:hypothetical protein
VWIHIVRAHISQAHTAHCVGMLISCARRKEGGNVRIQRVWGRTGFELQQQHGVLLD